MTGRIIGTGSYVPERIVTNEELAEVVETSDEWIVTRTGIHERRIAETEGTSVLAARAAERALKNANVSAEEVDFILLATSSPDHCFPNGACEVQAAIGAVRAMAFDISAACSGFEIALSTAQAFIQAGVYRTGLIIGADCLSKLTDWSDRATCVLFGDGAGAAVIQADEKDGIIHTVMGSDGARGMVLSCLARSEGNFLNGKTPELGYIYMNGQEVFKFAVKKVPECINQVLSESGTDIESVKYFVLHQANYRICEAVAKRLKQPLDKVPMNIDKYGNTSGATVPILLDQLNREGKLSRGDKLVLAGFGGGLTWGSRPVNLVVWNADEMPLPSNYKRKYFISKEIKIMLEKMKEIIADQLSVDADSITEASSFKEDLGADSLDLFELVMALEDEYSVEIPSDDLQNLLTVGDVMNYLKEKGVEA